MTHHDALTYESCKKKNVCSSVQGIYRENASGASCVMARRKQEQRLRDDALAELAELARRVTRLCPDRRDPERFHADKSVIAAALAELARELAR